MFCDDAMNPIFTKMKTRSKNDGQNNAEGSTSVKARFNKKRFFISAIALVLLLLGATLLFFLPESEPTSYGDLPTQDSIPETLTEPAFRHSIGGLKTWVDPDIQKFSIENKDGATIEGKDGTLIIVPTNAFLDADGNSIEGAVDFELVEALHITEMVLYNLATASDGTPLESGGMFYLNASKDGAPVIVNPERPLYIEVPTEEQKPGMMAFSGEPDEDGNLNWKDPQPLKKYLATVDLELLDFLPAGFEAEVKAGMPFRKHKTASNALVDSLYYSLSPLLEQPKRKIDCGIDPLSIKTIRTGEFQNTFVATSDFEARVQALHDIKRGQRLFDMYIDNIGMNLFEIDSMVMKRVSGSRKRKFNAFYQQKLTTVKDSELYQERLSAYYNKKKQEFADEIATIQEEYEAMKSKELNALYKELRESTNATDRTAATNLIPNSLLSQRSVANSNTYAMQWANLGWTNIDAYLHMLSKEAKEVEIIVDISDTDSTQIYQWLNVINTITPLLVHGDLAKAVFPEENTTQGQQMRNTYAFAISENDEGYHWGTTKFDPYAVEFVDITMKSAPLETIRKNLDEIGGHGADVTNHLMKLKRMVKVQKQIRSLRREVRKGQKFRAQHAINDIQRLQNQRYDEFMFVRRLKEVAFPCPLPSMDGCFVEGTTISLINGEEKPIHFMKVGEEILAYDTVLNKQITATVTKLHVHDERIFQVRTIILDNGKNTMVTCTDEHPFWTGNNKWERADKLSVGDVLHIMDEKTNTLKQYAIKEVRVGKVVQVVYNISTTAKNYYANGILVHNK